MKEAFELIRKKLDEESVMRANSEKFYSEPQNGEYVDCVVLLKDALSIVSEVEAEYINKSTEHINKSGDCSTGWIPCSERLPENMQQCLTTAKIYVVPDHVDEPDNYIGVELNAYSEKFGWLMNPNVIAWMPLPEPYKPEKGE